VDQTSCAGDTHTDEVAAFTTQAKADRFIRKLRAKYPRADFYFGEHFAVPIDPEELDELG
jgi:hypothetical protein